MVFKYQPSDRQDRLFQGEILSGLLEPHPEFSGQPVPQAGQGFDISFIDHPMVVIITPDCDLLTDFSARKATFSGGGPGDRAIESRLLQHIQCCDVYQEGEIRQSHSLPSDLWKRVRQNQDERYHCLPEGGLELGDKAPHPTFFLDFKRMFSVPTDFLYESLKVGEIERRGIIPPPWVHSLIQRYFAFHSRVGVPDVNDANR